MLFGEVCVVESVESVSNRSLGEQCFLGNVSGGEKLVVLEDAKHELRAGREVHQSVEPLLLN